MGGGRGFALTILIKIGGAALEDAPTLRKCARAIAELAQDGHRVAVVHGGGAALTRTRLVITDPDADRIVVCSLLHVASVDLLQPAA